MMIHDFSTDAALCALEASHLPHLEIIVGGLFDKQVINHRQERLADAVLTISTVARVYLAGYHMRSFCWS